MSSMFTVSAQYGHLLTQLDRGVLEKAFLVIQILFFFLVVYGTTCLH